MFALTVQRTVDYLTHKTTAVIASKGNLKDFQESCFFVCFFFLHEAKPFFNVQECHFNLIKCTDFKCYLCIREYIEMSREMLK